MLPLNTCVIIPTAPVLACVIVSPSWNVPVTLVNVIVPGIAKG